jgi:hypothetical protein
MAPYEYKVTCEAAGHPGAIYHVRVWVKRTGKPADKDHWTLAYEKQIDTGQHPGEPRKQWRTIMAQLKGI